MGSPSQASPTQASPAQASPAQARASRTAPIALRAAALPSLEVLPHGVTVGDISAPLHALFEREAASPANCPDALEPLSAILLDGTVDPRAARTAALTLQGRTTVPRVAILRDSALAALSPEWGVADFLTPEASPAEIDARLKLLRAESDAEEAPHSGTAVEINGVEIDESNFVATVHGRTLDLTYKEFELLYFLARHPARVLTREQLLSGVWGTDYFGGARTVDVHVRRLRAKLGEHESLISTVRGVGYGFARGRE